MQTLDALTLHALASELNNALQGAKLTKLQHYNAYELAFQFWWKASSGIQPFKQLCVCLHPEGAFVGVLGREQPLPHTKLGEYEPRFPISQPETTAPENASSAFKATESFLTLRKALQGAKCVKVEALAGEPCLRFAFTQVDELGFLHERHWIVELMGKYSNWYLLETSTQQVLAMAHPVGLWMSSKRALMVTSRYSPPPKPEEKPFWFEAVLEEEPVDSCAGEGQAPQEVWANYLRQNTWGLHKGVLADLAPKLTGENFKLWLQALKRLYFEPESLTPGLGAETAYWTLLSEPALQETPCNSVLSVVSAYYFTQWQRHHKQQLSHQLLTALNNQTKTFGVEQNQQQQALASSKHTATQLKRWGDVLLTAYACNALPKLESVEKSVLAPVFDEPQTELQIPIPPTAKEWSQVVQQFYRQAGKSERRSEQASGRLAKLEQQLEYLETLRTLLEQADSLPTLLALRQDFYAAGFLKEAKKGSLKTKIKPNNTLTKSVKGKKPSSSSKKPSAVTAFNTHCYYATSSEGWQILVGRSSKANAELCGKLARPTDYWLHVRQGSGSHVLVKPPVQHEEASTIAMNGALPPTKTLEEAAALAAWFSSSRYGGKVAVVVTQSRYVKKIPGSWPGHVTYSQEQEVVIQPRAINVGLATGL